MCDQYDLEEIYISRTKKGYPALWEEGGGYSRTGSALIISGTQGEKLHPVFIKDRGPRACGQHALFIIRPGYHIVYAGHHIGKFFITVWKVNPKIAKGVVRRGYSQKEKELLDATLLAKFEEEEWNARPPEFLTPVIETAKRKAQIYHCRTAVYALK